MAQKLTRSLRAIIYDITPVDATEIRRIACRLVPATITTVPFAFSLSCIEFVKLTQGAQVRLHRNSFDNLALHFFTFAWKITFPRIDVAYPFISPPTR